MVCKRLQYLQLISRAIEEAKMSTPSVKGRSVNTEDCTDPYCDCPRCQLKAHPPPTPVNVKSSMLSCCGSGRKVKSKEDARSTSVCKCASEGDASLKPAMVMSGQIAATSATSATWIPSATWATSTIENCDACDCGCEAELPARGGECWLGYIRRPFVWMYSFLPFGRLPRPDIAISCISTGGTFTKRLSNVVGRKTKVVASTLWTFLMNFIILLLRVAVFLIDLSMVLLHALTHWYCVARRGWRTRTISTVCTEPDRRHYGGYDY